MTIKYQNITSKNETVKTLDSSETSMKQFRRAKIQALEDKQEDPPFQHLLLFCHLNDSPQLPP